MNYFCFVSMVPYARKKIRNATPLTLQLKVCELFLNFLLNGPHKASWGILEILKIEFCFH